MSLVNYVPRSQNALRRCALQTKTREVYMISLVVGKPTGFAAITKTMIYKPRVVLKLKGKHLAASSDAERVRIALRLHGSIWSSPPPIDRHSFKRQGTGTCTRSLVLRLRVSLAPRLGDRIANRVKGESEVGGRKVNLPRSSVCAFRLRRKGRTRRGGDCRCSAALLLAFVLLPPLA